MELSPIIFPPRNQFVSAVSLLFPPDRRKLQANRQRKEQAPDQVTTGGQWVQARAVVFHHSK